MTLAEFRSTLTSSAPPEKLLPALVALWHDAKGDWTAAHEVAQDIPGKDGSWVHAYLHRKEGDATNAAYWYSRAGRPVAHDDLGDEWGRIVEEFVARA
jgi:hypothetical protein